MRTSAAVAALPGTTLKSNEASIRTGSPFASGVPVVSRPEASCGGPQEPYESGAPCVVLGAAHCLLAGTREMRKGEAPRGRG
jgi:hypothetical protein